MKTIQSYLDKTIDGIRELEAERTRYKKQLESIKEIIYRYESERPTGFMVKAYCEIVDIMNEGKAS